MKPYNIDNIFIHILGISRKWPFTYSIQPFFLGHFTIPKNITVDIQTEQLHFEMLVEGKVFTDHIWEEKGSKRKV